MLVLRRGKNARLIELKIHGKLSLFDYITMQEGEGWYKKMHIQKYKHKYKIFKKRYQKTPVQIAYVWLHYNVHWRKRIIQKQKKCQKQIQGKLPVFDYITMQEGELTGLPFVSCAG